MARSNAETVEEYLSELSDDRRAAISKVRRCMLDNLPDGFVEVMNWGMICHEVPLETFPDTYNKRPLMFAALASQKNYMSVYLMSLYCDPQLERSFVADFEASGMKLDMGKSCVRFKTIEQLPVELIGETVAKVSLDQFLDNYRGSVAK